MPFVQARVRNMGSLQGKVARQDESIQSAVVRALNGLRQPIEDDIKRDLNRKKSGPVVKRYGPSRRVRTSMPGEAPAKDRGNLMRSVEVEVDPVKFNMVLSANDHKARELEYGTRHMLARPFLRPALTRWRGRIVSAIQDAIRSRP